MAADPTDQPHDILAAEEFGMGTGDPALHQEPAHDVLAAEEFGMGTGDPHLHHGPMTVPPDPSGIEQPHDVLAADEFAVPAGPRYELATGTEGGPGRGRLALAGAALVAAAGVVFAVVRRRFS